MAKRTAKSEGWGEDVEVIFTDDATLTEAVQGGTFVKPSDSEVRTAIKRCDEVIKELIAKQRKTNVALTEAAAEAEKGKVQPKRSIILLINWLPRKTDTINGRVKVNARVGVIARLHL